MEKDFSIFKEPDENMRFTGKPTTLSICDKCVNRYDNGECDMCDEREQTMALVNNSCVYFIAK